MRCPKFAGCWAPFTWRAAAPACRGRSKSLVPFLGVGGKRRHLDDMRIAGCFPFGNVACRYRRSRLFPQPLVELALTDAEWRALRRLTLSWRHSCFSGATRRDSRTDKPSPNGDYDSARISRLFRNAQCWGSTRPQLAQMFGDGWSLLPPAILCARRSSDGGQLLFFCRGKSTRLNREFASRCEPPQANRRAT